jgi:hypothetical protein
MTQDNGQFPIDVALGKLSGENLSAIAGKMPFPASAIPIFNSYFFSNFAPLNALKNTSKIQIQWRLISKKARM